ncbi:Glyoxalase/Bleomycin resistance protein/Dioxygenase superfamily protein [Sporobacter termitidis DSM 10068]|uniref:Glyoxalase/Bleomycin resistance protein/Dioxygenase superfamily protein n=1 Tax=Sporobacter termitidis DSM 10068 TaxID=1123282 RepID=A0A1M5YQQ6_9FIRM|nr:VOC family protein [Sporobacter termitidis]SHI14372.1 Glyoxalase/Bleomycin resistance protein/Dioxygenase superfamily protein [Sporobacter termitidis DSM 10068]
MKFWHIGILTPDVEKTLDALCAMSGGRRGVWQIGEIEFPSSEMITGSGGRLKTAVGRMGGIVYELIQPLDEHSFHAAALKRRGPGLHHAAYVCGEELDADVASCIAAGAQIVWEARHGEEHVCYLEAKDGGSVLELINICPPMPEE